MLFLKRRPTSQRIVGERKPVRYFADNFRVVSEETTNIPEDSGRKETGSLFFIFLFFAYNFRVGSH